MIKVFDEIKTPRTNFYHADKNIKYSETQQNIINNIIERVTTPDKKNSSFLERHPRWDYFFEAEKDNSVGLSIMHRIRSFGMDDEVIYNFRKDIGVFDKKKPVDISNLKKAVLDYKLTRIAYYGILLLVPATMLAIGIIKNKNTQNTNIEQNEFTKTEIVAKDSCKNDSNKTLNINF